jgi:signal transduction histidine kinase
MAGSRILQVGIDSEQDIVLVRQRARQIASLLNFSPQDQVRIATAVSEVARCAHGQTYGARAEFALRHEGAGCTLDITIIDGGGAGRGHAHGLKDDQLDAAVITATRLMDGCEVTPYQEHGIKVSMRKRLARGELVDAARLALLGKQLSERVVQSTFQEMQVQNQELAQTLAELRERQDDLLSLTRELEDTNRGVLALYAEIEEKAERLRYADDMKSRFLSNTSHELRTPLSSIRALAELLLSRMDGELTQEQERQVGFIATAAADLSALVNDLLDMAKIEAGKVDLHAEPVHIASLFSALKGMLRPLIQNRAVELVFSTSGIDQELVTDEGKLAQILRNFISNALKFTERGSVTVALSAAHADTLTFAVTDTGIGISEENLQLIFEEFSQIEHPLQRRSKGTGLGLPLCRKLAHLLGGEVHVESRAGAGSTFSLTLPRAFTHGNAHIDERALRE